MKRKQHKGFSKTTTNFKTNKKGKKFILVKGKASLMLKKNLQNSILSLKVTRTYILLGSWPLAAKVSGESPLTALEGRKVVGDSRTEF